MDFVNGKFKKQDLTLIISSKVIQDKFIKFNPPSSFALSLTHVFYKFTILRQKEPPYCKFYRLTYP